MLAVVAMQHGPPKTQKDEERYGIPVEPLNAKRGTTEDGDAESTSSSAILLDDSLPQYDEHEVPTHGQALKTSPRPTARLSASSAIHHNESPPPYVEYEVPIHGQASETPRPAANEPDDARSPAQNDQPQSALEDDPLWRCVQSELKRENGKLFRFIFHNRKNHSIDPMRKAVFMGLKIIVLSYLPRTKYICLFLWCLFDLVSISVITGFHYSQVNDVCPEYSSASENNCTRHKHDNTGCLGYARTLDTVVAVTFIVALGDFLVLILYSLRECYEQYSGASSQGRTSSLRHTSMGRRLRAMIFYWRKYSDIPRLFLSEALLYTIYSLQQTISCHESNITLAEIILVLLSLVFCFFIQFAYVCVVIYSVSCKPTIAFNNHMLGLLIAFLLNFLVQRVFEIYELSIIFILDGPTIKLYLIQLHLVTVYFVSVLGILTFFIIARGLLKVALIKTFIQLLTNLQKCSDSQNRERIQYVLDKFDYPSLCQYIASSKLKFLVQNPLLGTLMIPFVAFLGVFVYVYSHCEKSDMKDQTQCRIGLALGLVFNVLYVLAFIGWLITVLFRLLAAFMSCCTSALHSTRNDT